MNNTERARKIIAENRGRIAAKYQSGFSELACAKFFGVSRLMIRRVIVAAGIRPRTGSEANFIRMGKMSERERKELTKAANKKTTGQKQTPEFRHKVALGRFRNKHSHLIGTGEKEFGEFLKAKGFSFTQQAPVGPYNIDFMLGESIAVELLCTSTNPKRLAQHLKKSKTSRAVATSFVF